MLWCALQCQSSGHAQKRVIWGVCAPWCLALELKDVWHATLAVLRSQTQGEAYFETREQRTRSRNRDQWEDLSLEAGV